MFDSSRPDPQAQSQADICVNAMYVRAVAENTAKTKREWIAGAGWPWQLTHAEAGRGSLTQPQHVWQLIVAVAIDLSM